MPGASLAANAPSAVVAAAATFGSIGVAVLPPVLPPPPPFQGGRLNGGAVPVPFGGGVPTVPVPVPLGGGGGGVVDVFVTFDALLGGGLFDSPPPHATSEPRAKTNVRREIMHGKRLASERPYSDGNS